MIKKKKHTKYIPLLRWPNWNTTSLICKKFEEKCFFFFNRKVMSYQTRGERSAIKFQRALSINMWQKQHYNGSWEIQDGKAIVFKGNKSYFIQFNYNISKASFHQTYY